MTSDKNYLGEGNVDKFDALFFKLRQFVPDDQGENYFFCIGIDHSEKWGRKYTNRGL